jgi:hypothetical protein
MTTSETATALWEEQQRGADIQRRLDAHDWLKNFAIVVVSIALTLTVVAALNGVRR